MRRSFIAALVVGMGSLAGAAQAQDADAIFASSHENGECVGYACAQLACTVGTTRITGIAYAPNGTLPLPGVTVFVPNAKLDPMPASLSCDRCSSPPSGNPLVSATSGPDGRFVIENAPATTGVRLVVQSGRWRRETTIPVVAACTDTAVAASLSRLPRSTAEGDIPRIAVVTGGADSIECLVRKTGLDATQFGVAGSPARVHLYAGNGGTDAMDAASGGQSFLPATSLWNTLDALSAYDIVTLGCEGSQDTANKSPAARQAMKAYADAGGRVLAAHLQNYWIQNGPGVWPTLATWSLALASLDPFQADIEQGFPRGAALAGWLFATGSSATQGRMTITGGRHTAPTVDETRVRKWIHAATTANAQPSVQYFSFNAPIEAAPGARCGRVVFTDMHSASGDSSNAALAFPSGGCVSPAGSTSAQEKVLLYTLFDIGTCVGAGTE